MDRTTPLIKKAKRWGQGRVVFMAEIVRIRDEISRAIPLTEVYATRAQRLGIGYSAFCKLVAKYAADAKISPTPAHPEPIMTGPNHAGHKPVAAFSGHTGIADPALLRKLTSGN